MAQFRITLLLFTMATFLIHCSNPSKISEKDDYVRNYNTSANVYFDYWHEWNLSSTAAAFQDSGQLFTIHPIEGEDYPRFEFHRYNHQADTLISLSSIKNYYYDSMLNDNLTVTDSHTVNYDGYEYFYGKAQEDTNSEIRTDFLVITENNSSYIFEYKQTSSKPEIDSLIVDSTLKSLRLYVSSPRILEKSIDFKLALSSQDSMNIDFICSKDCNAQVFLKKWSYSSADDDWNLYDSEEDTLNPTVFSCQRGANRIMISTLGWDIDTTIELLVLLHETNDKFIMSGRTVVKRFQPVEFRSNSIYNSSFSFPLEVPRYFVSSSSSVTYGDTIKLIFGVTDTVNNYPFEESEFTFVDSTTIAANDLSLGRTFDINNVGILEVGKPYRLLIRYHSLDNNNVETVEAPCKEATYIYREL